MSSENSGPGWWKASDGNSYPPDVHHDVLSGRITVEELIARSLPPTETSPPDDVDDTVTELGDEIHGEPVPEPEHEPVVVSSIPEPTTVAEVPGSDEPDADFDEPASSFDEPVDEPASADDEPAVETVRPSPFQPRISTGPVRVGAVPAASASSVETLPRPAKGNKDTRDKKGNKETDNKEKRERSERRPPLIETAPAGSGGKESDQLDDWDEAPERLSRSLLIGIVVAAVALIAMAVYFLLTNDDDSDPASTAAPTTSVAAGPVESVQSVGQSVPLTDQLTPGVCLNSAQLMSGVLDDVEIVSCDVLHQFEVYNTVEFADGPADFSPAVIDTAANDVCLMSYESYVGITYEDSDYYFVALTPVEQDWTEGDRTIVCLLRNPDTEVGLTGSAAGSAT